MFIQEIIEQLEGLAAHCDNMVEKDDPESIWANDVAALNEAISRLSGGYKGKDAAAIIRKILNDEGIKQRELAERMGCVRQNVSQMLNRDIASMRYDSFYKMVEALGFEIVVRKK